MHMILRAPHSPEGSSKTRPRRANSPWLLGEDTGRRLDTDRAAAKVRQLEPAALDHSLQRRLTPPQAIPRPLEVSSATSFDRVLKANFSIRNNFNERRRRHANLEQNSAPRRFALM